MIFVVQTRSLEMLPPLISLLKVLKAMGERVVYLGLTDTPAARMVLNEFDVEHRLYNWPVITFRERPILRIWRELTKKFRIQLFRRWVWKQIDQIAVDEREVVIWSSEMISAAILGDRALRHGRRHVQIFYELGDDVRRAIRGFDKRLFYQTATIVECERHRAEILQQEEGLSRCPFVLPNKPFGHPGKRNLLIRDEVTARTVARWGNKKVLIYQGALQGDRQDIIDMLSWLCEGLPEAIIAVMSRRNEIIDALSEKYSNFSYVPFVSPPAHLEVTSHAHVGLAAYNGKPVYGLSPLNGVYCAPNKIFEYSGFGMPVLCNDIEGLRFTIGDAGAGICVSMWDREHVVGAAQRILEGYSAYSENAIKFFSSVDLEKLVGGILNFARGPLPAK